MNCWSANGLAGGAVFSVEDWPYTPNRGAGSHLFELVVDGANLVTESDESDNNWAYDFTWLPSELDAQSVGSPLINRYAGNPGIPSDAGPESEWIKLAWAL